MTWTFSKRCKKSLKENKIKVSIPLAVRNRLWVLLENCNEIFYETTETGFNYSTSTLEQLPQRFKAELGSNLLAFPEDKEGPAEKSNLEGFILRGNYSPNLFDTLELFFESVGEDKKNQFQCNFNQIMEESNLPWRMADGKIFPVDSAYIEEEIVRRSYNLLHETKFQGTLHEFEKARAALANDDCEGAIQNANLAVESVIKEILGIEKAKPGELFRKLIDSDLIPKYYRGFLKAFEENILRCVAIIRNEELGVGHGRGPSMNIVPTDLAELAVHLSSVLINFLIKRHLEKAKESVEEKVESDDEEIPF